MSFAPAYEKTPSPVTPIMAGLPGQAGAANNTPQDVDWQQMSNMRVGGEYVTKEMEYRIARSLALSKKAGNERDRANEARGMIRKTFADDPGKHYYVMPGSYEDKQNYASSKDYLGDGPARRANSSGGMFGQDKQPEGEGMFGQQGQAEPPPDAPVEGDNAPADPTVAPAPPPAAPPPGWTQPASPFEGGQQRQSMFGGEPPVGPMGGGGGGMFGGGGDPAQRASKQRGRPAGMLGGGIGRNQSPGWSQPIVSSLLGG
jgi:hypothetical protein